MRVRWTDAATRDLTHICDYTHEHHGPEQARKLALHVYDAVGSLAQFPRLGRLGKKPGTRELVFSGVPFFSVYRARKDVIESSAFCMVRRNGRRQTPDEAGKRTTTEGPNCFSPLTGIIAADMNFIMTISRSARYLNIATINL